MDHNDHTYPLRWAKSSKRDFANVWHTWTHVAHSALGRFALLRRISWYLVLEPFGHRGVEDTIPTVQRYYNHSAVYNYSQVRQPIYITQTHFVNSLPGGQTWEHTAECVKTPTCDCSGNFVIWELILRSNHRSTNRRLAIVSTYKPLPSTTHG